MHSVQQQQVPLFQQGGEQRAERADAEMDARIAEIAETYQRPEEVLQWYKQDRQRLANIESDVLEQNVVDWFLARAKVVDKAIDFDDIMGQQGV